MSKSILDDNVFNNDCFFFMIALNENFKGDNFLINVMCPNKNYNEY